MIYFSFVRGTKTFDNKCVTKHLLALYQPFFQNEGSVLGLSLYSIYTDDLLVKIKYDCGRLYVMTIYVYMNQAIDHGNKEHVIWLTRIKCLKVPDFSHFSDWKQ